MSDIARMMIKNFFGNLFKFPAIERLFVFVAYQRKRYLRRKLEERLRFLGLYGETVQNGPFRGMVYPGPEVWLSCRFEKVMGFYEFELYPWIDRLLNSGERFTSIVNIGAADGYFAVGLGRLIEGVPIYAFEADDDRFQSLVELGELNGLSGRLVPGSWCSPLELKTLEVGSNPLVICDVEGYEDVLMDPTVIPWLRIATILLEVHEFLGPSLSEDEKLRFEQKNPFLVRAMGKTIRSRFRETHGIEECLVSAVPIDRYPVFHNLAMGEISALTESDRCCIHPWFLMTPTSKNADQN